MHILLIRHGETEHNVNGLLAGVTDSKLTNHGVLQAKRLARFLATDRQLQLTRIFASDLQRAWMTADEVRKAQSDQHGVNSPVAEVVKLALLQEQDFGSYELAPWASKSANDNLTTRIPSITDPNFKPKETAEAMRARADSFLDDYIVPLLALQSDEDEKVAIVSHGLFLSTFWRALLGRFKPEDIKIRPDIEGFAPGRPLEYIGAWSNTGYLELSVDNVILENIGTRERPNPIVERGSAMPGFTLKLLAVNRRDHLENLKRTRGVGSATYDSRQKQIDGFFKRPKT